MFASNIHHKSMNMMFLYNKTTDGIWLWYITLIKQNGSVVNTKNKITSTMKTWHLSLLQQMD